MAAPVQIPLTRGLFALVDPQDAPAVLAQGKWTALAAKAGRFYAVKWKRDGKRVMHTSLHRFLMVPPAGFVVDHISGDALDNRRCNLRVCTAGENLRNRKPHRRWGKEPVPFKGVRQQRGRFYGIISLHREVFHLGGFATPEEAARAYDAAAVRLHGAFARLNFPAPPDQAPQP